MGPQALFISARPGLGGELISKGQNQVWLSLNNQGVLLLCWRWVGDVSQSPHLPLARVLTWPEKISLSVCPLKVSVISFSTMGQCSSAFDHGSRLWGWLVFLLWPHIKWPLCLPSPPSTCAGHWLILVGGWFPLWIPQFEVSSWKATTSGVRHTLVGSCLWLTFLSLSFLNHKRG